MGKKAATTAVKLESTVAAATIVEPKTEAAKKEEKVTTVKLEEESLTETAAVIETPRYVHDNPRAFKGRLGYAYVLAKNRELCWMDQM